MSEITRRRQLGTAGAAAGGAVLSSLLPPSLGKALAAGPRRGSLGDIKHVVVLMEENRSFDHYFGTLGGVRGFGDPHALTLSTGRSVFYQPDPANPDGYLLPWHLATKTTSSQAIPSTSHAWSVQHRVLHDVRVGRMPWSVALTAGGASAYVTNANSDTVSVIDTGSGRVTDTIVASRVPTGIAALQREMWVAGNVSSTILVIDTDTNAVTHSVALGISQEPTTIAFA